MKPGSDPLRWAVTFLRYGAVYGLSTTSNAGQGKGETFVSIALMADPFYFYELPWHTAQSWPGVNLRSRCGPLGRRRALAPLRQSLTRQRPNHLLRSPNRA
jgi:hypothetical protein